MWHLFKNNEGLFEFAFISKGEYVAGTRQGYERRSKALSSLYTLINSAQNGRASRDGRWYTMQDDSGVKSVILSLGHKGKAIITKERAGKPYIPKAV